MLLLGRNYILQEDLDFFLPAHKAAKAFEVLDIDQDGKVSLHDIRDAILQIYKVGTSSSIPAHQSTLEKCPSHGFAGSSTKCCTSVFSMHS